MTIALLEAQRDAIIDDTRLADMSNSQLTAVADGLAKMIEIAAEGVEPNAVIEVASLDIIDQRLTGALRSVLNPALLAKVTPAKVARPKKATPKKVTKKRTAKKASKKR